jgi:hypothetical protein
MYLRAGDSILDRLKLYYILENFNVQMILGQGKDGVRSAPFVIKLMV